MLNSIRSANVPAASDEPSIAGTTCLLCRVEQRFHHEITPLPLVEKIERGSSTTVCAAGVFARRFAAQARRFAGHAHIPKSLRRPVVSGNADYCR